MSFLSYTCHLGEFLTSLWMMYFIIYWFLQRNLSISGVTTGLILYLIFFAGLFLLNYRSTRPKKIVDTLTAVFLISSYLHLQHLESKYPRKKTIGKKIWLVIHLILAMLGIYSAYPKLRKGLFGSSGETEYATESDELFF